MLTKVIKRGADLGYRDKRHKYQLTECDVCGKVRMVRLLWGEPRSSMCKKCAIEYAMHFKIVR